MPIFEVEKGFNLDKVLYVLFYPPVELYLCHLYASLSHSHGVYLFWWHSYLNCKYLIISILIIHFCQKLYLVNTHLQVIVSVLI